MELLIIFCATYLIVLSPLLVLLAYYLANPEKRKLMIQLSVVSLPIAYLLSLLARYAHFDPRPFVVENVTPLIPHVADNGFPSDHMLLAATLAAIVMCIHRKWSALLWLIALVVGFARVAAHVHHVTDILGSAGIAIASIGIGHAIIEHLWNKKKQIRF